MPAGAWEVHTSMPHTAYNPIIRGRVPQARKALYRSAETRLAGT